MTLVARLARWDGGERGNVVSLVLTVARLACVLPVVQLAIVRLHHTSHNSISNHDKLPSIANLSWA